MKRIFTLLLLMCGSQLFAQQEKEPDHKAVPQSSAFKLVDISPTLIETPVTPKAFGLGILQNFDKGSSWPQNYSAEFTPYWWALPKNRDAYKFLGIRRHEDPVTKADVYRSNPFSALKMTNISVAFLQKDLVPDTADATQKVFSAGFRTTLLRFYSSAHSEKLNNIINDIRANQSLRIAALVNDPDFIAAGDDPVKIAEATKNFARKRKEAGDKIDSLRQTIEDHIAQKPAFQWDLAGAYATYGIADTAWKTGRVGIWSTLSLNLLLNAHGESTKQNYLTISAYTRYMYDNYTTEKGFITNSNSFDVGGRLSFEFDPLSIGFEAVHRNYVVEGDLQSQRVIGFLNYRVGKDLYLNGAFGSDFGMDKSRILALFGLNWGFGNEKLTFKD
ncbi:hypothetical protein [Chitinophaga barathri]|uniref:DUF3078 domain-containing protein n=1 Tax=Chitinophaga barathri TaxID=1647451 RepID=A0A3N4M6D3_9BACT|nr:hypothetical protein [Chitinophaga barathri]RPD38708.1 hypothetical protein EG028_23660 [Chitinophaga barathri]